MMTPITILARLTAVETRLRNLGQTTAAETAARYRSAIARGAQPFLYERFTADLEDVADKALRRKAAVHYAAMAREAAR